MANPAGASESAARGFCVRMTFWRTLSEANPPPLKRSVFPFPGTTVGPPTSSAVARGMGCHRDSHSLDSSLGGPGLDLFNHGLDR